MSYSNLKKDPIFIDIALLIVRLFVGFAMLSHGFPKLQMLLEGGDIKFFDFLGLGPKISLGLTVFAEFVCSIFLILGLFTRIAVAFLTFTMIIAGLVVHGSDSFDKRELSLLYLAVYVLILVLGAGRFSVDWMIEKRRRSSEW
ncbi:DoxX family protein [Chryseobacterium chendengshani]|uniref:DoxX family protein n=1 Tax=Chryseobacterium sp. LJ756 TaxID=2864113 RepID=UPI001C640E08|nr:DoxX family protein [Chryseobacterium sp. LJ756]MBW7674416.1 DoxX family protein [Chryseobacterium sp. LJ756]